MAYALGKKSITVLKGAHSDIGRVVRRAITISKVDFLVHETLRSVEQQKINVANGVSWTLDSKHIAGPDGLSRAVDLLAVVEGKASWAWPLYFRIAEAMQEASQAEAVSLTWGGVWDHRLSDLGPDLEGAVADYGARRKKLGKAANLDGPHFEMARHLVLR